MTVQPIQFKLTQFIPTTTARKFIQSNAKVKCAAGPFGSGKSSMCVYDLYLTSMMQPPADDGVRYTRHAAVRGTYSDLVASTMKTWDQWIPEYVGNAAAQHPFCPITRPMNGCPTGHMKCPGIDLTTGKPDGTTVDMEILFISCDDPRDIGKLRSTDFTKIWWNEISMFRDRRTFDEATARVGRFPDGRFGKCARKGVIGDTNPCDTDHWYYQLAELEKPEGYEFFKQPPAIIEDQGDTSKHWAEKGQRTVVRTWGNDTYTYRINPGCENLSIRGADYWLDMIPGKSRQWIKVYLMCEYGSVENDRPVFQLFSFDRHVAKKPLEPIKGLPLIVSLDFGMTPAAAILQLSPLGQLRVLDEITTGYHGATCEAKKYLREFIRELLRPRLLNKYAGMRYLTPGDPVGGRQRAQTDGVTCYQVMYEEGFDPEPMQDYSFQARVDAVNLFLSASVDRGEPACLISPNCETIIKALAGRYCYPRSSVTTEEKARPEKNNIYSHVMDALEGACLFIRDNNLRGRSTSERFGGGGGQATAVESDMAAIV